MSLFSFLRPKTTPNRLLAGQTDRHCHLLPGVDDGIATVEEARKAIQLLKNAGVRGVCCTPHIKRSYPNKPDMLQERFEAFRQAVDDMDFPLELAAEYMLDENFEHILRHDTLLPLSGGELLVELPQYMLPEGWMDVLMSIREKGLTPLLAHPERYLRTLSVSDLEDLPGFGILLQGNIGSLNGYYGRHVQETAQRLHKQGLYHCWGTDLHSAEMVARLLA